VGRQMKKHTPIQLFKFGIMFGTIMNAKHHLTVFGISGELNKKIEDLIDHITGMIYEK